MTNNRFWSVSLSASHMILKQDYHSVQIRLFIEGERNGPSVVRGVSGANNSCLKELTLSKQVSLSQEGEDIKMKLKMRIFFLNGPLILSSFSKLCYGSKGHWGCLHTTMNSVLASLVWHARPPLGYGLQCCVLTSHEEQDQRGRGEPVGQLSCLTLVYLFVCLFS